MSNYEYFISTTYIDVIISLLLKALRVSCDGTHTYDCTAYWVDIVNVFKLSLVTFENVHEGIIMYPIT